MVSAVRVRVSARFSARVLGLWGSGSDSDSGSGSGLGVYLAQGDGDDELFECGVRRDRTQLPLQHAQRL